SDSGLNAQSVLINGSLLPPAQTLKRGTSYRIRLANLSAERANLRFELKQDTTATSWRPIAKDGIDIPAAGRAIRAARQPLSIAETMDFEWTPVRAGDFKLEAVSALGRILGTLDLRVR